MPGRKIAIRPFFHHCFSPTVSCVSPWRGEKSVKTLRQWPEMVVKLLVALTINCSGLLFFFYILTYSWDAICQMTVSASSAAANWQSWRCHERTFWHWGEDNWHAQPNIFYFSAAHRLHENSLSVSEKKKSQLPSGISCHLRHCAMISPNA